MNKKYITTPIYYVNAKPHVGHAYTTLAADIYARFYRDLYGEGNIFFMTGTDEHGDKILEAANKEGEPVEQYVDKISNLFKDMWKDLNIKYNHFFRTTDPRHKKIVQEILQDLYNKEFIYKKIYEGYYCVGCEKYLNDREIVEGKCPVHSNRDLEYRSEENYFFKITDFTEEIEQKIKDREYNIVPEARFSEIISRVDAGIQDISISRNGAQWGIDIPWDNNHKVYVWFEALLNYYTATVFLSDKERFFPADIQFLAKDILWFHSFIQQATLLAMNKPLPKTILSHGFFTVNGCKMSKSIGNVIDPKDMINRYGVDATRYLLISSFAFGGDGDIKESDFDVKYKGELSDSLGNLVSRVAKLAEGFNNPHTIKNLKIDQDFQDKFISEFQSYRPDKALKIITNKINKLNLILADKEPWKLEKEEKKECILFFVSEILGLVKPISYFMPSVAEKILDTFNKSNISKPEPLFPRLNKK